MSTRWLTGALLALVLGTVALAAQAEVFDQAGIIRPSDFSEPELEERYRQLGHQLRCPKCQNQSVGDSDSPIALDLRREIRDMLEQGMTDREIKDFMQQRYGDYILYQPRMQQSTVLLWSMPVLLLLVGLGVVVTIARRQRRAATEFEPDEQALEALLSDAHPESGAVDRSQRPKDSQ